MNTDFRNRVVLPILLPIGVLLGIGAFVGLIAFTLLYNERETGLVIALVAAAGLMVAFSLANAVDEDDMTIGRRGVILAAGALPIIFGFGAAITTISGVESGDIDREAVPAYYEPKLSAPEGAVIGAQNVESFCAIPTADAPQSECVDTKELTLPVQPEAESFAFTFVNYNNQPHNVQIFELAEDGGEPAPGAIIFGVAEGSDTIVGPDASITYEVTPNEFEEGQQFFYNCVVHPVMNGVLTIGPAAE